MVYNSFYFVLFVCLFVLVYYAVPWKLQTFVLLLASVVFYALQGVQYLLFILFSTFAVFQVVKKIDHIYCRGDAEIFQVKDTALKKEIKQKIQAESRCWLFIAMFLVLGPFIILKYINFFIANTNSFLNLLNTQYSINVLNKYLPVGISFYSFMMLGYILDVYWKRYPAEKQFINFAVFGLYFPHIVQGPIGRYNYLEQQIRSKHEFKWDTVISGAQLMIWGFFKKLVIADRINIFVSAVYDEWTAHYGIIFVIATILYSIQIYADFSGCIDIVRGTSEMFGIRLEKNFNHPYFSKSMPEFWRRWHISLNQWFKDYLYYPVSVSGIVKKYSKKIKLERGAESSRIFVSVVSALIVWMVTGLWHGAEWKFVVWGIFHAILIIMGIVFEIPVKRLTIFLKIKTDSFSWNLFQMVRTFILCSIGRIFFRAENIYVAFNIIKRMLNRTDITVLLPGRIYGYGLNIYNFNLMLLAIAILLAVDILQEKMSLRASLAKQQLVFRWMIIYGSLFAIIIFGIYGPGYEVGSFIYNQF